MSECCFCVGWGEGLGDWMVGMGDGVVDFGRYVPKIIPAKIGCRMATIDKLVAEQYLT